MLQPLKTLHTRARPPPPISLSLYLKPYLLPAVRCVNVNFVAKECCCRTIYHHLTDVMQSIAIDHSLSIIQRICLLIYWLENIEIEIDTHTRSERVQSNEMQLIQFKIASGPSQSIAHELKIVHGAMVWEEIEREGDRKAAMNDVALHHFDVVTLKHLNWKICWNRKDL